MSDAELEYLGKYAHMATDTDLPKQDRLLKLLRMTTSSNDGEALTALRLANKHLIDCGWDWEKLILAKIRIIEDPFKNIQDPARRTNGAAPPPSTAYTPQHTTPRRPAPPPPPNPRGTPANPLSSTTNRFVGWCWCCGIEVVTAAGFIFKPTPTHTKWECVCATCNTSATVMSYAANHQRTPRKRAVSDLA